MRHVDFTPFYRSTVGFDRLFDFLFAWPGRWPEKTGASGRVVDIRFTQVPSGQGSSS